MQAVEAKDIRKALIMRCQAGQTIIVNYIYSSAFGMPPRCFQEYKVVSSTCSRFSLLNGSELSVLKFNKEGPVSICRHGHIRNKVRRLKARSIKSHSVKLYETLALLKCLQTCQCAVSLLWHTQIYFSIIAEFELHGWTGHGLIVWHSVHQTVLCQLEITPRLFALTGPCLLVLLFN